MKSRILSSDQTLLRKDILRFAPVWGLYTLALIMGLVGSLDIRDHYYFVRNVDDLIRIMGLVNLLYAPVVAQMLFGDLFNSRMCNALHALPVKRETWFKIHLTAGLLFSFLPNLAISAVGMIALGEHWFMGLTWLVQSCLQYVCFFGMAVAAVFCAGNRFAMLVVYGMINFLAGIVYWMVDALYEPLLYGIWMDLEWFAYLMPVYAMIESYDIMVVDRISEVLPNGELTYTGTTVAMGEDYWMILPYALVGIVFMVLALQLYRKRKLEVAGDFLAVRKLEPFFLVVFTLCASVGFSLFRDMFGVGSEDLEYIFLAIGLVTGYFACRMLLSRSLRVFHKKNFVQVLCIGAALAASLLITWLDPLGFTRWVPQTDEVASVRLQCGSYWSEYEPHLVLTEPGDIDNIRALHRYAIEHRYSDEEVASAEFAAEMTKVQIDDAYTIEKDVNPYTYSHFCLEYTMENGNVHTRFYRIYTGTDMGQMLKSFYTRPECVLETTDIEGFLKPFSAVEVDDVFFTGRQMEELLECILLDCAEGTMAQSWDFHIDDASAYWVRFQYKEHLIDRYSYFTVDIFESNTHTVQWLKDHGLMTDREKYESEYYG